MDKKKFALSKYLSTGDKLSSPRSPKSYSFSVPEEKPSPRQIGGTKFNTTVQKDYTSEKIQEMLENYDEIPRNEWANLQIGTHIRYMKKSGDFKPGGFIRNKKLGDKPSFLLENVPFGSKASNPNYVSWMMLFDSVLKVFAKNKNSQSVKQDEVYSRPNPPRSNLTPAQPTSAPAQPTFNPEIMVEFGILQREFDDVKKKLDESNNKVSKLHEELADLTLIVRKMGKYLQTKGADI